MGTRRSAQGRVTAVLQPRGLPAAFPVPQFPHLGPAGVRWWRAALPARPGNRLPRVPPLRQEKKLVLIDLPCAAMWMQFPAQGVERGGLRCCWKKLKADGCWDPRPCRPQGSPVPGSIQHQAPLG